MRGEDPLFDGLLSCFVGSPPHARGRPSEGSLPSATFRITPACAGKTFTLSNLASTLWDHPRMRGEDVDYWFFIGGE